MKKAVYFLGVLFSTVLISCSIQAQDNNDPDVLVIESTKKGKTKTVTINFSELEKGLEQLGEALEEIGDEIEAEAEATDFEFISVEEKNGETIVKIRNGDDGERKRVLKGKEAEEYLESRRNDDDAKVIMDMNGNLTMDVKNNEDQEEVHIEINVKDFLKDIGIVVESDDEEKSKKKKVIIITKSDLEEY